MEMSQYWYPIEHTFFVCACMTPEHTLRFTYDPQDNQLYCYVYLNRYSFLKRLWRGIKYICGYQCKYGAFDEFIMDPADAESLIETAEKIRIKYSQQLTDKVGIK